MKEEGSEKRKRGRRARRAKAREGERAGRRAPPHALQFLLKRSPSLSAFLSLCRPFIQRSSRCPEKKGHARKPMRAMTDNRPYILSIRIQPHRRPALASPPQKENIEKYAGRISQSFEKYAP